MTSQLASTWVQSGFLVGVLVLGSPATAAASPLYVQHFFQIHVYGFVLQAIDAASQRASQPASQPAQLSQSDQPVEICITLSLINIFYAPFEFHSKSKFAHTPTFFHFISIHFVLFLPVFVWAATLTQIDPIRTPNNKKKKQNKRKPTRDDHWQRVKNDFESCT